MIDMMSSETSNLSTLQFVIAYRMVESRSLSVVMRASIWSLRSPFAFAFALSGMII